MKRQTQCCRPITHFLLLCSSTIRPMLYFQSWRYLYLYFFGSANQTVTIINYELHFCLSEVIGGDLTNRPDISHRHIWPSDLHPACGSEQVRRLSKPAEMIGCTILFLLCAAYFSGLELVRRNFKGFKMPPLADVCPRSARPARKKSFRGRCNSCR